jgi:3-oxoacyl-[acyl-carrier protein] reductase
MPEDVLKSITEKVPVQRMGTVEDISSACLFLASDQASYINGAVLSVDGGVTL